MIIANCFKISLAVLTAFFFSHCGLDTEKSATKPNVLFILCDDLNDYVGAYNGHPQVTSPNIDKLAASGVIFTNAHSNCPLCAPSRNSLFTGVYPHDSYDFGFTDIKKQSVLKHNKTLMELFSENGYHVMGSGKLLHHQHKEVWDEWGVDIDYYGPYAFDGIRHVGHPSVPEPFRSLGAIDGSFAPLSDVPFFPGENEDKSGWIYSGTSGIKLNYQDENNRDLLPDEMHAQWAVKRIKEMDSAHPGKPFFMGVGFVRPHTPLYAPKRFFDMFPVDEIILSDIKEGDTDDTRYKEIYPENIKGLRYYKLLKESYGDDSELGLKHFVQAYLASVAFIDEQVGLVIEALKNSSFKNNTIIIFTSDHGWQMGEKQYLFKNSPWEESTRVPFIIDIPKNKNSARVDHPVSLIDIYPTLVDLCGLSGSNKKNEHGGPLGGYSLKSFLNNPKAETWEGPNGALTMIGVGLNREDVMKQTYSYRARNWRYILYMDGSEELYHNKTDPYEWNNLAEIEKFSAKKTTLRNEMIEIINQRKN